MFLSTRNYHYIYNFIVKSSKKNCENIVKKKLELLIFKIKKLPSLKYLIFFSFIIFSGKIFKKNRAQIKYDNIEIGRFVLSQTFCDFECYLNKFKFYKRLIKNFLHVGSILNTCNYYNSKFKISGVYVDHCGYLNGIIFSFFALKKKIVYTNNNPLGIYNVNYEKNNRKHLLKFENSLRITIKKKLNNYQKKKAEKKISNLTKKATFIPYLVKVNYKKLDNINYKLFDYVVYCHSFTDGQLWHGYAGFENTLEWLEFTLDNLIEKKKQILIKPHPNFYNNSMGANAKWDKKIYETVVNKYKRYDNLLFLNTPVHNYLLLKQLNKNCILLSLFGTTILESAYMNFKSICTSHNFFDKKFQISNMWQNKINYSKLLNLNVSKLKRPNKIDLLKLSHAMFFYYTSFYHKNYYTNIIRNNLKLKEGKFQKQFLFKKGRKPIPKSILNRLRESTRLVEDKIIDEISKTIFEVKR